LARSCGHLIAWNDGSARRGELGRTGHSPRPSPTPHILRGGLVVLERRTQRAGSSGDTRIRFCVPRDRVRTANLLVVTRHTRPARRHHDDFGSSSILH
jgi:hypothetical protein